MAGMASTASEKDRTHGVNDCAEKRGEENEHTSNMRFSVRHGDDGCGWVGGKCVCV